MTDDEGIRITTSGGMITVGHKPASVRWHLVRVLLMRILSVLWMMQALFAWAMILGAFPGTDFATLPLELRMILVASAVLNCIVAVGLWLAAAWGGALWLLLAAGQVAVTHWVPEGSLSGPVAIATTAAAACLYALFSIMARRESRRVVH